LKAGLPGIQSARILEEIADLKKNICHCGKHARDWCSAAQYLRGLDTHVPASCRILVKQPFSFPGNSRSPLRIGMRTGCDSSQRFLELS